MRQKVTDRTQLEPFISNFLFITRKVGIGGSHRIREPKSEIRKVKGVMWKAINEGAKEGLRVLGFANLGLEEFSSSFFIMFNYSVWFILLLFFQKK